MNDKESNHLEFFHKRLRNKTIPRNTNNTKTVDYDEEKKKVISIHQSNNRSKWPKFVRNVILLLKEKEALFIKVLFPIFYIIQIM